MYINQIPHHSFPAKFVWLYIWGPISFFLAFFPLIVANFIQLLCLLFIYPFSVHTYRAAQRKILALTWGYWVWGLKTIIGIKIDYSGNLIPKGENAIVISNHQCMVDIIVLLFKAYEAKGLGKLIWIAKDVLRYVPGIGWGLAFTLSIFVKRSWEKDAEAIYNRFQTIANENVPIWVCSFPEGTRKTDKNLAKNTAYGKKKGLPPTQHVLYPRSKGFLACVNELRDHVQAVYSFTIQYEGKPPGLLAMIRGDVKSVKISGERFPIDEIPNDDAAMETWLLNNFLEKEKLLSGDMD